MRKRLRRKTRYKANLILCRIKEKNPHLNLSTKQEQEQGQQGQQGQEQVVRRVISPTPSQAEAVNRFIYGEPAPVAGAARGAEKLSPATSTPSSGGGNGAIWKDTYYLRDRSLSGVISPIRGDISAPAGTFYQLRTPLATLVDRTGLDDDKENFLGGTIKEEDEEEEDDNHGQAGHSRDMLAVSGPSVTEQGGYEPPEKRRNAVVVVDVNNEEVMPIELREDEFIGGTRPEPLRSSKRKQANPKRFTKK